MDASGSPDAPRLLSSQLQRNDLSRCDFSARKKWQTSADRIIHHHDQTLDAKGRNHGIDPSAGCRHALQL